MKVSTAIILALPALVSGFTPAPTPRAFARTTSLSAEIVTGKEGKPASSPEEDLELALQIIMEEHERAEAEKQAVWDVEAGRTPETEPESEEPAPVAGEEASETEE